MQNTLTRQRSTKFINLTDAVAERLEMNQELSEATDEALQMIQRYEHIRQLSDRNSADRAAGTAIRFKRLSMQNKLRAVALTQTQELIALSAEKEALIERNFPAFRCDL